MNYKVMKRPMFRLGGSARPGYQSKGLVEIEDLIKQRAAARDKLIGGMRTMMPLQVLAGRPGLQTIRKPTDVLNILSDIGQDPNLFNALMRSQSLDLKMKEGELTDKITLEKLKSSRAKGFEFEKRMKRADELRAERNRSLAGKTPEEQEKIKDTKAYKDRETDIAFLLRGKSKADYLLEATLRLGNLYDEKESSDRYDRIYGGTYSQGGRVGYQEGTPEPMMKETISVEETLNPVKEQPQESTMSVKQMYDLMRQRIPQANVSDKDLYKIASSEQIMADFASLETMSDVTQFNEQYDTNIVLDLPIVG